MTILKLISRPATNDWYSVEDINTSLYCNSPSPLTGIRSPSILHSDSDTTPKALHVHHGPTQSKLDLEEPSDALQQQLSKLSITATPSPRKLTSHTPSPNRLRTSKYPSTPSHRISKYRPPTPGAPRKVRKRTPLHIRIPIRRAHRFRIERPFKVKAGSGDEEGGKLFLEEMAETAGEVNREEEVPALEGERNLIELDIEVMDWDM